MTPDLVRFYAQESLEAWRCARTDTQRRKRLQDWQYWTREATGMRQIVSGPAEFGNSEELIRSLRILTVDALALDRDAVVYVRADGAFTNGNVHLEAETLPDSTVAYNIVITPPDANS